MRRDFIALVIVIITITIFYFFILPSFNLALFLESLKNVNPIVFFLALLAVALSQIIVSLRWALLMQEVNARLSGVFLNALGICSIGQATGLIVPSRVGAYVKVPFIMKLDNLSYEAGVAAVNTETLLDLVYLCCAGILSFLILSPYFSSHMGLTTTLVILGMGLLIGIFILFVMFRDIEKMNANLAIVAQDLNKSVFIRAPAQSLRKLMELILSTKNILQKKPLIIRLGLTTLFTQFFGIIGLFLVIGSVSQIISFPVVFALLTVSYIIGIASLVPGGFGASDLSLIVLLGSEGIPYPVGINIAILWRVAMYLPVFVIVGICYIYQKMCCKDNCV